MPSGPARALACLLLAALLLPTVAGALGVVRPSRGPGAALVLALDPSSVGVAVDPATWSMFPGASVAFTANASGLSDGCSVFAAWYDWSLPPGSFDKGYLNSSTGPTVTLSALANASGSIEVDVSALFALTCPDGSSYDVEPEAAAFVHLLPGLEVGGVSVSPDPVRPGASVTFRWNLSGGEAPYGITVDFGDGNRTVLTQAQPGSDSVAHAFAPGEFDPAVHVTDARGVEANGSPSASLVSAPGLSARLAPSGGALEVGRPVTVSAEVEGGLGGLRANWTVTGVANDSAATTDPLGWNVTPLATGPLEVTLHLVDGLGENSTASATFFVAPGPRLDVPASDQPFDVGVGALVNLSIAGGVGPYLLHWSEPRGNDSGELSVKAAGEVGLPVEPSAPGPFLLALALTDARGGSDAATFDVGPSEMPALVSLAAPPGEVGEPIALWGVVTGGVPPFVWDSIAAPAAVAANGSSGRVDVDGAWNWTETPVVPGNLSIALRLVDARGDVAAAVVGLPIQPALGLAVAPEPGGQSSNVTLDITIEGGVAPYTIAVSGGTGGANVSGVSADGVRSIRFVGLPAGTPRVSVELLDAAGAVRRWSDQVPVAPGGAPATAPSSGAGGTSWLIGGALLAGVAAAGAFGVRWRGERPGRRPRGARALAQVQRALEESDGLDAETLEFLGESEGLRPADVRAALARWSSLGRIRSDDDGSGVTRLRWVPPTRAPEGNPSGESP